MVIQPAAIALEALAHEAEEHLPAVVTEGGSAVRVHSESMRSDLEILEGGRGRQNHLHQVTLLDICS